MPLHSSTGERQVFHAQCWCSARWHSARLQSDAHLRLYIQAKLDDLFIDGEPFKLLTCRNESDAIEAPVQQSISVSAKEVLDLTATFTLAEAIQKSMRLLEALRSVANAPQQLEAVLEGSLHERGWGHASVCWLQNETGLSAQCWLDPTLQPSSKKPGEMCMQQSRRTADIMAIHVQINLSSMRVKIMKVSG